MKAGVEVGADVVLAYPGDDEGIVPNVIDVIITDLRNVLFAAGKLPRPRPQPVEFLLRVGGIEVAVGWNVRVPEELVGLRTHPTGRGHCVLGDDLLGAGGAGAAGLALIM